MPPKSSKVIPTPPPVVLATTRISRKNKVLFEVEEVGSSRSSVQRAPSASSNASTSNTGLGLNASSAQLLAANSLSGVLSSPTGAIAPGATGTRKGTKGARNATAKTGMKMPAAAGPSKSKTTESDVPAWVAQQQLQHPSIAAEILPSVVPSPLPFIRRMSDPRWLSSIFPAPWRDSPLPNPLVGVSEIEVDDDRPDIDEDDTYPTPNLVDRATACRKRARDNSITILSPANAIAAIQRAHVGVGAYATALAALLEATHIHIQAINQGSDGTLAAPRFDSGQVALLEACYQAYTTALFPLMEATKGRSPLPTIVYGRDSLHHVRQFLSFANVLKATRTVLELDFLLRRSSCEPDTSAEYHFGDYFRIPSLSGTSRNTSKSFLRHRNGRGNGRLDSLLEVSWRMWVASTITRTAIDGHWMVRDRAAYVRYAPEMAGSSSGGTLPYRSTAHHLAILGIASCLSIEALRDMQGSPEVSPLQCSMLLPATTNDDGKLYAIPTAVAAISSPNIATLPTFATTAQPAIETQASSEYRCRAAILQQDVYGSRGNYINSFGTLRNAATAAHGPSRALLAKFMVGASQQLQDNAQGPSTLVTRFVRAIQRLAANDGARMSMAPVLLLSDDVSLGRRRLLQGLLRHVEEEDGLPRYMRYVHRLQQQQHLTNKSDHVHIGGSKVVTSVEGIFPSPMDLPPSHFPLLADPAALLTSTPPPLSSPNAAEAGSSAPTGASWINYECGLQEEIVEWFKEYLSGSSKVVGSRRPNRKIIYPVLIVAPALVATRLLMKVSGPGEDKSFPPPTLLDIICCEVKRSLLSSTGISDDVPLWRKALHRSVLVNGATDGFHTILGIDTITASLVASSNAVLNPLPPVETLREQLLSLQLNLSIKDVGDNTDVSQPLYGFVAFFHTFAEDNQLAYYISSVVEMN